MELDEILNKIEERWAETDNFELIIGLQKDPQGAATGTEGLLLINAYIQNSKTYNFDAYQTIKDLADELELYVQRRLKNIK
jgi:hypothetical protein